ncbi:uncharacterized protein KY384_001359 [Bacidia gigantensis]|uniref:uncharacterized protein n=1 Tax=Bacidia gigantensis TaxID=2732470 RepID=UPI001D04D2D5|nr:uncharacterized protein KY384_001359 [Bacidia gigantensis]KAG8533619.1 hypothetical protein KY384_001359 [Bacidia gigantensis]
MELNFVHIHSVKNAKGAKCTRAARSKVIKEALMRKRKKRTQENNHFVNVTSRHMGTNVSSSDVSSSAPPTPRSGKSLIDLTPNLAAEDRDLLQLMHLPKQAAEPIFNIDSKIGFQDMHTVFRTSLKDPALLNALLYTLQYAKRGNPMAPEVLSHRGQAMQLVNQRIESNEDVMTAATIGAILLLVGVEASSLIDPSRQDLYVAALSGFDRVLGDEVFPELGHTQSPLKAATCPLPPGFMPFCFEWTVEFTQVLQQVRAFQNDADSTHTGREQSSVICLDNQQAAIESRLYTLRVAHRDSHDISIRCCIEIAYICTYMLFTPVWESITIPSYLATKVLEMIRTDDIKSVWADKHYLLLWVLCVGGTFAGPGHVQMAYAFLLSQLVQELEGTQDKDQVIQHLNDFIWSTRSFGTRFENFWALCQGTQVQ